MRATSAILCALTASRPPAAAAPVADAVHPLERRRVDGLARRAAGSGRARVPGGPLPGRATACSWTPGAAASRPRCRSAGATSGPVAVREHRAAGATCARPRRRRTPRRWPSPRRLRARQDGWIMIGVHHAARRSLAPAPAHGPRLQRRPLDANGLPLNPQWGLQQTQPGALPNPVELCFDVPGWFDNPICTVQRPTLDRPWASRTRSAAIGATTPIAGHVNWFPATYQGPAVLGREVLVRPGHQHLAWSRPSAERPHRRRPRGDPDASSSARETLHHFATPWWKRAAPRREPLRARARAARSWTAAAPCVTGLARPRLRARLRHRAAPGVGDGPAGGGGGGAGDLGGLRAQLGQRGLLQQPAAPASIWSAHRHHASPLPWREGATGVRLGRRRSSAPTSRASPAGGRRSRGNTSA